ncbi:hypothetical protein BpHYR1_020722 [Brachionus plicatilis]|uniref:Uncharacterized protein n=1 Tax=Brachionus plicatilis TaxID=10195 RepID=A0A3M7QIU6_BRAPC|nr:hypothetical protein BpHYR1_020722 [Brachionus plicatilis]
MKIQEIKIVKFIAHEIFEDSENRSIAEKDCVQYNKALLKKIVSNTIDHGILQTQKSPILCSNPWLLFVIHDIEHGVYNVAALDKKKLFPKQLLDMSCQNNRIFSV